MVLNLYKEVGETPLQAISRFRAEHEEFAAVRMTYAGRLDPMAEGVLIVLTHDDVLRKEEFLALDKEYIFEAILGIETDTYDILGKITRSKRCVMGEGEKVRILKFMKAKKGKIKQKYPPYSSKTLKGKQLWQISREGKISEDELPEREVEIYESRLFETKEIAVEELEPRVIGDILKLKGDFRQEEIIKGWKELFSMNRHRIPAIRAGIRCSSGTYIRSLVYEMGKALGCGATALRIARTKVGDFEIRDSVRGKKG